MIYGYIRVSTDTQDTENQKLGIEEKAKQLGLTIEEWISDDGVSGAKEPEKRLLGKLLGKCKENDVIIISEISRIGRRLFMVFRILETLLEKGVKLYSVKDGYSLDNTITSKVLAFAFGMAAEIERDMIQKRTKEGLARRKKDGIILGRPVGRTATKKLDGKEEEIQGYIDLKVPIIAIARIMQCDRLTLKHFIEEKGLRYEKKTQNYKGYENKDYEFDQYIEIIENTIKAGGWSVEITKELNNIGFKVTHSRVNGFLNRKNFRGKFQDIISEVRKERNKTAGQNKR